MRKVSKVITVLADDFDPMMGQKSHEYCELMTNMAIAIEKDDRIKLKLLVKELEGKPGI